MLLGVSGASGLGLPGWAIGALFAAAVAATAGLVARERRAAAPLVDLSLLRAPAVSAGLAGAMCGYLVLFGPLVLVPQILAARGTGAAYAGLILTALPAGFALAALAADRILPQGLGNRRRCLLGGAIAVVSAVALSTGPSGLAATVPLLALLGTGLGLFVPANNTAIMAAIPRHLSATAGGMVNMTRGVGTALGIALVTLALHESASWGARAAFALLAVAAVLATATGLTARAPGASAS